MSLEIILSDVIPASPQRIYDTWLDAKGHAAMTGSERAIASREVGGSFMAWDDYITGRNLALEPAKRILQSWRSAQFEPSEPDSRLEVLLEPVAGGTKVTLRHTDVPDSGEHYRSGWQSHYLDPMKAYFAK